MRPERAAIGRISRSHGVRGEMLVKPYTDVPDRFEGVDRVWLVRDGKELGEFRVERVRTMTKGVGLKLEGISTPESVNLYRGSDIEAAALSRDALDDDQFFVDDLVGLTVVNEDGTNLGTVKEVVEMRAHDILVVRDEEREWQLPFVDEFLVEIDLDAEKIVVRPPDGLLEL